MELVKVKAHKSTTSNQVSSRDIHPLCGLQIRILVSRRIRRYTDNQSCDECMYRLWLEVTTHVVLPPFPYKRVYSSSKTEFRARPNDTNTHAVKAAFTIIETSSERRPPENCHWIASSN
jgi:hypothetical protein